MSLVDLARSQARTARLHLPPAFLGTRAIHSIPGICEDTVLGESKMFRVYSFAIYPEQ